MTEQTSQPAVNATITAATGCRRGAFTLVELVVAIGILVMMMTMAGTVFSLTLRSTGQAKALTNLSERLRMYERTVKEDLRAVRPGSSMMALECRQVWIQWTGVQRDLYKLPNGPYGAEFPGGGDPERMVWDDDAKQMRPELPRADVLTFFTAREAASMIAPSLRSSLQLVSYGHVKPGDLSSGGAWIRDPDAYFNIEDHYADALIPPWTLPADRALPLTANQWLLGRRQTLVMNVAPSGVDYATLPSDDKLFDGRTDILVSQSGGSFDYVRDVLQQKPTNPAWRRRAKLDLNPPAVQANRMGAWFLPNCASFKVEWALSHPKWGRWLREQPDTVWVDSSSQESMQKTIDHLEAIRNRYDPLDDMEARADLQSLKDLFEMRFVMLLDPADKRVTWAAEDFGPWGSTGQPPAGEPDPFFPTALRITVDLYDDTGRLDRPIRHVMVVPVGPG